MLTYAAIALGGALGSMARYGGGLAVARWTGPDFPWGTIAINIFGSFLIGLFATATAGDGRFPLPADARNLLIVGLCGGFTTFSSFSLQTLELLRAGRPGWALANIALSVGVCLGAVALGYYAGEASRPTRVELVGAAQGPERERVVLAVLDDPATAPALLKASTRLARLGMAGSVTALAVRLPPPDLLMPTEEVETGEHRLRERAAAENWSGQLTATIQAWMQQVVAAGIGAQWLDVEGNAAPAIAEQGKTAEALVVAIRGGADQVLHRQLHAALFDTGTATLVVPPGFEGDFGRRVAILWQDDGRVARACGRALPLLKRAERVHILWAGPQYRKAGPLPPVLAANRIAAERHFIPAGHEATGARLLAAVRDLDADLVVMGAYGHGEWREAVLGGVTHTLLAEADIPLLMQH